MPGILFTALHEGPLGRSAICNSIDQCCHCCAREDMVAKIRGRPSFRTPLLQYRTPLFQSTFTRYTTCLFCSVGLMPETPCLIWRGCDLDLQVGAPGPPAALLLQQVPVDRPLGGAVADDLDLVGVCVQAGHWVPHNAPPSKAAQRHACLRFAPSYTLLRHQKQCKCSKVLHLCLHRCRGLRHP